MSASRTLREGEALAARPDEFGRVHFVLVTGLSGAGKSQAAHVLEDLGFFCVDNLPPALLPRFAELLLHARGRVPRAAAVVDIRSGEFFEALSEALQHLDALGLRYRILFLDASDEVLVRRFKETRRKHPLAATGSVLEGIREERRRLEPVRERAHRVLDTSDMTPAQLRSELRAAFGPGTGVGLAVTVVSFGYKHGLPLDADLVFDTRFLPNPHYVDSLRDRSGLDPEVRSYVLDSPQGQAFWCRMVDLVSFLLPEFEREGKTDVTVAVGCTGGRHRSVAVAEELVRVLRERGYEVRARHRDLHRE
ncbi:MAG: RNase adapter RapZ [Armatimonadota bacterium]|nr:RNase adapter RapZ [Armatimonadota bacterium]MDR5676612.1 RNase adapter RapZ [Armatimonadota bacterium]MDR5689369.1 RNase adapter RapZ [Armatimonadota bacterium]MDR7388857.1 RNase adapter RapZ [Armatimonadota bacterium]MDR7392549.1 RNase adapter RapZ [Armatimonadota bacterium]